MIKYIGKCLLIEDKERILVIGDLHLGYDDGSELGSIINKSVSNQIFLDFDQIFEKIGVIDKVILLGDLKNEFSLISQNERMDIVNLIDHLEKHCNNIIIIKGNHDNYLENLTSKRNIIVKDYYIFEKYCFLHGDRDFIEIYNKKIAYWIMGHLHPAIKLKEGSKVEKYKCFLEGKYNSKNIIILPSFIEINDGIDIREINKKMTWDFDFYEFKIIIVENNLENLDFGKLKNIT